MSKKFRANKSEVLGTTIKSLVISWVNQNTAILIVHGIGNQIPLVTLDQFGRGILHQFHKAFGEDISISHQIFTRTCKDGPWFENVIRISKAGSDFFIDVHEHYWANLTEDKTQWSDLNKWLQGVVKGAKSFYKRNAELGQQYKDQSIFFDTTTGRFKVGTYRFFLSTLSKIFIVVDLLMRGTLWLVSLIPLLGKLAQSLLESYKETIVHDLTNILGDVVTYNVTDPKSKFFEVRRKVHEGAVEAIQHLIEKPGRIRGERYYPSVIVAGHSLGSQICYDAINKINLLVNKGQIEGYNSSGGSEVHGGPPIAKQLRGFITFGCPLDKIVFFLRENVPDDQYIRQQVLDHYHGFKQRDLDAFNNSMTNPHFISASTDLERLLEKVKWRNYYDHKDYVSGGLDYFEGLTNIDCRFKAGKFGFTHSDYWESEAFYKDIVCEFLSR